MDFENYRAPNGDIQLDVVKKHVAEGWDPKENGSEALRVAIQNNDRPAFDYLLPLSDPSADSSLALQCAAHYNRSEMLSDLLPHCDPNAQDGAALLVAAKSGSVECFEKLVRETDPRPRQPQIEGALQNLEGSDYLDQANLKSGAPGVVHLRESVNARCERLTLDENLRQAAPVEVPRPVMKRRL